MSLSEDEVEEGWEGSLNSFFLSLLDPCQQGEEKVKSSDLSVVSTVTLLRQDYFISEGKLEAATAIKAAVSASASRAASVGICTMTLHCMRLFVLLLLGSWWPDSGKNVVGAAKIREHYIAAQTIIWTYKPEPEEKSR